MSTTETKKNLMQSTNFLMEYVERPGLDKKAFDKEMNIIQGQIQQFKNLASSNMFLTLQKRQEYLKSHEKITKENKDLQFDYGMSDLGKEIIPDFNTGNINCIVRELRLHFTRYEKDILSGARAIPSSRCNQPIPVKNNKTSPIKFIREEGNLYVEFSMFSREKFNKIKDQNGNKWKDGRLKFKVDEKCESAISIINRCMEGEYTIRDCKFKYDNKKKKWKFLLSYGIEQTKNIQLDPERILGIDLGVKVPIYAVVSDSGKTCKIEKNEIDAFRKRFDARKAALQNARPMAGKGSVGHGYKTRMKAVNKLKDKMKRYRNTKNDAWSRELVNFAIKNGCGTIQMENLERISKNNLSLQNWVYYDLQEKIRYKAEAAGIEVNEIIPKYTSQRCAVCGNISAKNRPNRDTFICQNKECDNYGKEIHADLNAAKNIATKGIEDEIKKEIEKRKKENAKKS